jgi:hypothetical protein
MRHLLKSQLQKNSNSQTSNTTTWTLDYSQDPTLTLSLIMSYIRGLFKKYRTLILSRLNTSSTGSVLLCRCGGDIYAHVWIVSRLQKASVAGSRSMIVYVLWALSELSKIAKWRNELSSVIALNFAKSLAILKLKPFKRFNRLSGTMPWVSHK